MDEIERNTLALKTGTLVLVTPPNELTYQVVMVLGGTAGTIVLLLLHSDPKALTQK